MILKTLLSTFLLALFVIPAEGGRSGIVPTVDDSNRVSYQQSGYYLPSIEAKYKLPKKTGESLGLSVTADSVIIIDDNSGQVLWQKNPGRIHSLASLTKLMTAYLFLQQDYDFDQVVEITQTEKSDPEESTLTVSKGEQVTVYDLFFSSLVGSANNATRELISSLEKSEAEFVEIMNQKAAELGMANTHFVDVTGIGKGNTSTVADYIKLVRLAFSQEEIQKATVKTEHRFISVSGNNRRVNNSNDLLEDDLAIMAGKTGFTYEAGYCLAVKIQGEDDNPIIVLSLGSQSSTARFSEVKNLISSTYANYRWD